MERQLARWRAALAAGIPRRGWKVGLNVPEVQARLGLGHPLVGWLDGGSVHASGALLEPAPGARWHVEPELAIRLAAAVDPAAGASGARACIGCVAPALEIVDYARPPADLESVIEHSMFHAGCVVGVFCPADAAAELGTRWPLLRVGGRAAPAPRADLVPADLGELIRFAAELLARFGERLEAGDLVLSGSYLESAVAIDPHCDARADFGPLGEVRVGVG